MKSPPPRSGFLQGLYVSFALRDAPPTIRFAPGRLRRCIEFETLPVARVPGIAAVVLRLIRDYRNQEVRLTDERLDHIVRQHPEAARLGVVAIEDALRHPDAVIVSPAAPDDRLYYRRHLDPQLGDKFLCVVVKSADAFVVTAYVTARQKGGVRVWPETT